MERNVARLFRDHVSLFGEVHFTQASILTGMTTLSCSLAAFLHQGFRRAAMLHSGSMSTDS